MTRRSTTPSITSLAAQLQRFGINWNPAQGTINGATYDTYANPGQASFWVARSLELIEDFQNFGVLLRTNPVEAVQWFISWQLFDFPTHILEVAQYRRREPGPGARGAARHLSRRGWRLRRAGRPGRRPAGGSPAGAGSRRSRTRTGAGRRDRTHRRRAGRSPGDGAGAAPAPSSPPTPPGAPAPPPPAPAAGPAFFPPYVLGPPGIGVGSGLKTSASSGAKKKGSEPDAAEVAAASAARQAARARRRRSAKQQDHGDEFMDMNVEVDPDWSAAGLGSRRRTPGVRRHGRQGSGRRGGGADHTGR